MMDPHHDTGADNLRGKSVEEQLEKILREAEASLSELRSELAEQRRRKELSLEIERLPEHLENTTVQWSVVRDFFSELIGELRETREDKPDAAVNGAASNGAAAPDRAESDDGLGDTTGNLEHMDAHDRNQANSTPENSHEAHGSQR